ncbi:MAG TPA: PEP-CTERM sorting domain-containing protein, partial [Planctomycetota bacterium]|nr:PEP-CTERM sorting domain-containing protein [Planctomycetota bacterium]
MNQVKIAFGLMAATCTLSALDAQTLGPDFASTYSINDLGSPAGVLTPLGGIQFKPGDSNTLLIGGSANGPAGAIYELPVARDGAGHIVAFGGPGVLTFDAPYIDGGIVFAPNGVMMVTAYPTNQMHQYLPGSTTPDTTISLTPLGVAVSVGTCPLVPAGFPGAGKFKVGSYNSSDWFDVDLLQELDGTYSLSNVTSTVNTGGGPEGIVYVSGGNTGFANDSALVSEYLGGRVSAYELDSNGDPVVASRRDFITGLLGAEGAVIDPVTGDFLFSTFGSGNQVLVVQG